MWPSGVNVALVYAAGVLFLWGTVVITLLAPLQKINLKLQGAPPTRLLDLTDFSDFCLHHHLEVLRF
jgi:hypothetical protein